MSHAVVERDLQSGRLSPRFASHQFSFLPMEEWFLKLSEELLHMLKFKVSACHRNLFWMI